MTDPCEQLNKDWDKVRKPLNTAFKVFPKGINLVVDGMNDLSENAYESFNGVVNAINFITTEPLKPINELVDAVKTFVSTIIKVPSFFGIIQILLLPIFIRIKNVIDTVFFFLPNIPLSMVALLVGLVAIFVFLGHILGSFYSVGVVAFRSVNFISNWFVEPILGLFLSSVLPKVFIDVLGWATLALFAFIAVKMFVRIPVPCNCGDAPSSQLFVCQKDSEKGSENCKRIATENEKIANVLQRIKERGGRIVSKAEALLPELPVTGLPPLKVPKGIPRIPENDLFPALGLPKCGAQLDAIIADIEKAFEDARKEAERLAKEAEEAVSKAAAEAEAEAKRLAAETNRAAEKAAEETEKAAQTVAKETTKAAENVVNIFTPKPKKCIQRVCTKSKCVKRNFLGLCTKNKCLRTKCILYA